MIKVIALDLEGTLISNALSQIPRPNLFSFLEDCNSFCDRIVIFTTVGEDKFREIATLLVDEEVAPSWFKDIEYINWEGKTKDVTFISDVESHEVLLIDDFSGYVHLGQESQWIEAKQFAYPYSEQDLELVKSIKKLRLKFQ